MTRKARRRMLQAMAATVAGGVSGLIQQVLAAGNAPAKPGMQRIQGKVTVNGQAARAGMLLRAGDTVETGPGSDAIYVIGADAFLQRADTRVSFGATTADFMRVVTGKLLSVFGKGQRRVQIPFATIGIRGTGCYIESDVRRSYFCLCYGEVVLDPVNGRAITYKTQHHDTPHWIEDGVVSNAPVINHTDDELLLLEQLVGRWPPFYGVRNKY